MKQLRACLPFTKEPGYDLALEKLISERNTDLIAHHKALCILFYLKNLIICCQKCFRVVTHQANIRCHSSLWNRN